MSAADRYTHCPNCLAEYRAGYTICTDCGSLLVQGPSPTLERATPPVPEGAGRVEVLRRERDDDAPDRFALEETPIALTAVVHDDADAFLAALDDQEIGARRGRDLGDGGVEILVHAANLIDAQAVLVEFTGDVALVDEIAVDPQDGDDGWAIVTWVSLRDAGARTTRLRDRGVDVRLELPTDGNPEASDPQAAILVPIEDLETARDVLRIRR